MEQPEAKENQPIETEEEAGTDVPEPEGMLLGAEEESFETDPCPCPCPCDEE
jgi:hypothetical protein